MKYVNSPYFVCRCAKARKLNQQIYYSMEFVKKPTGKLCTAFSSVKARRFEQVKFFAPM